jgi:hypothetical protein
MPRPKPITDFTVDQIVDVLMQLPPARADEVHTALNKRRVLHLQNQVRLAKVEWDRRIKDVRAAHDKYKALVKELEALDPPGNGKLVSQTEREEILKYVMSILESVEGPLPISYFVNTAPADMKLFYDKALDSRVRYALDFLNGKGTVTKFTETIPSPSGGRGRYRFLYQLTKDDDES